MAMAKRKVTAVEYPRVPIQEEIKAPVKSTMTALVPEGKLDSLFKYVEGYPWTVCYYGQILNEHSTTNHFDPKQENLTQSYVEITDMTLRVRTPLSYSYSNDQGESVLTGSSITPFKIRPTIGDVFVAMVDSGEEALFVITGVERATHRKETLYEIEYSLYSYNSVEPDFYDKLKKRVNEQYYYDNYLDSQNRDVLITHKEKHDIDKLRAFRYLSQEYYFKTFTQAANGTISVPGVDVTAYDAFLMNFIMKTVEMSKFNVSNAYMYNNQSTDNRRNNFLDCLLRKVKPNPNTYEYRYSFINSRAFKRSSVLGSPLYSWAEYMLHPTYPNRDMISVGGETHLYGDYVNLHCYNCRMGHPCREEPNCTFDYNHKEWVNCETGCHEGKHHHQCHNYHCVCGSSEAHNSHSCHCWCEHRQIRYHDGNYYDVYHVKNRRNYYRFKEQTVEVIGTEGPIEKNLLPDLFVNDYYIVTEEFYKFLKDPNLNLDVSFIEILLARFLRGEVLSMSDLRKATDGWEDWSLLHQFYILPVVWLLCKATLGIV